jgi:hypothetical protein
MAKKNDFSRSNSENNILDNNMEYKFNFTDKINVKKAKYVYSLTLNEFRFVFWNNLEVDENGSKIPLKTFYKEVRKFCDDVIRNKVENKDYALIKRKYRYSNNKNGRIYVNGFGIQSLQGNLRKFLTGDYLLDIDIKNAHPNILYKLALEYNETHSEKLNIMHLENYCKNRQQILKDNNFDKTSLLICLNSDEIQTNKKNKGFYTKNTFLIGFHQEKMKIFHKLIKNTDYIKKYEIESTNMENPISSKINKLFCIKENEIIQSVMKSDICVPMFDGFMFPKEEKEQYDYLLDEKGLIQWDYKENLIDIDMSDFDESKSKDYETMKAEFEKTTCLILTKPLVFLRKQLNENNKLEDIYFDKKSMSDICEPLILINDQGKEESFFNKWLKDDKRKVYNKFDFNPYLKKELDTTPAHIYNTFNEFDCSIKKDYKSPDWFLNFVLEDICDGNKESYEYILNWIAHLLKKPYENCEVALVLRGDSGIGKDTLIEIIELIIGKSNDYVHRTSNINDILPVDGFNSELKNKLLIQFNEVEGKNTVEAKERIKDHITRKMNNIKEKYINPYKQKNLARCVFISNSNSPVQFMYDERRFTLFKCGCIHKGNTTYWNDIYETMEDINELDNVYNYLINRDISEWNAKDERPKTEAYLIAISNAVPFHIRWLNFLFADDEESKSCREDFLTERKHYYISSSITNVYNSYKSYMEYTQSDFDFRQLQVKKLLQDVDGIMLDKYVKLGGKSKRCVVFDSIRIKKQLRKYTFNVESEEDILDLDNL